MIAIIEDDRSIRELVSYTLENTGFEVVSFPESKEFWEFLENNTPKLLLLDIMLPNEDGISVLKKLRAGTKTKKLPIIMVTAKESEYDKIIGLDNGADDYITKPFGMMELISRIKALLRRSYDEENTSFSYLNLTLDDEAHKVFAFGENVELTIKEYNTLKLLLSNQGKAFNRDDLLLRVWGYDFGGETRTVDVHIRTLRQKLKECGEYIETVRGVGYRIGGK